MIVSIIAVGRTVFNIPGLTIILSPVVDTEIDH
jgi:hypothetical protein